MMQHSIYAYLDMGCAKPRTKHVVLSGFRTNCTNTLMTGLSVVTMSENFEKGTFSAVHIFYLFMLYHLCRPAAFKTLFKRLMAWIIAQYFSNGKTQQIKFRCRICLIWVFFAQVSRDHWGSGIILEVTYC